jgi:hypothetical protein
VSPGLTIFIFQFSFFNFQYSLFKALVQELLSHKDVSTTMIYTHVMDKGVSRTASPLDYLDELTAEEMAAAVAATRQRAG